MDTKPAATNPDDIAPRAGIGEVVVAELDEISRRRGEPQVALDPGKWVEHCHQQKLSGICISGGGIRSATFALGVLQGLVEKKLLSKADYISTVSGGGYVGAWLQGIAAREPDYEKVLDPERPPDLAAKDPITFLRKYSNYLAPRNGLSLDAVVIPVLWFRNMMLNQLIIVAALMATYIILLAPGAAGRWIAAETTSSYAAAMLVAAILIMCFVVVEMGGNLLRIINRGFDPPPAPTLSPGATREQHVGSWIVMPLFASVLLLIFAVSAQHPATSLKAGLALGFIALFALVALLQISGGFHICYVKQREAVGERVHSWIPWLHVLWMSLVTAAVLLGMVTAVWYLCERWHPWSEFGCQLVIAWAPPLYLLALILGVGLHIGLMGRDFPDASREWTARLGALLVTYIAIWAALFALAVFSPLAIAKLWFFGKKWWLASGGTAWVLSTIASVLAGKSPKVGGPNGDGQGSPSSLLDRVARYGPWIAIPGFLSIVAFGTQLLLRYNVHENRWTSVCAMANNYWNSMPFIASSWFPVVVLVSVCVIFVVLSWRVDINEFSMHHFYKNRLVRCYLGASAANSRVADPFTGFDARDDIKLANLRYASATAGSERVPYPIVNAALTVTAGVELATQERKALPWFFSPLYSGFFPARSDEDRIARDPDSQPCYGDSRIVGKGLGLGTAMAISGAAVNPNMGYHSSPQTAFLLTLFNVRLGWWLGNPTKPGVMSKAGPTFALWWLLRELLGFVDEGSCFINLSDGGHFENLGLYELVRRRCRYIIAIDGEQDTDYHFESLVGAVRKCRADFGIEIDIDPRPITPQAQFSGTHWVVGSINYKEYAEPGWLLYLKASITGDEPADVEEYRRENLQFPQQPTMDQFFSESQFESYRRLGLHVARSAFNCIKTDADVQLEDMFTNLASACPVPATVREKAFGHSVQV